MSIEAKICVACGTDQNIHVHHVRSRGSGGCDNDFNKLHLCALCHVLGNRSWHKRGFTWFFSQYPHVWETLKKRDWYISPFGSLKHPNYDKGLV